MEQEIPVYLFTGFMDSGKTTLIYNTLFSEDFSEAGKGIIIVCEEGDADYDEIQLQKIGFDVVHVEKEEEFTPETLGHIHDRYHPAQVFIEYNGTWRIDRILEARLPENWLIVQSLATVDATTFDLYINNMRTMMQEQLFQADVVIFNRTDDATDRGKFRRIIKTMNRKAQIVYERKDGTVDNRPEELPYDIRQDTIDLSDMDYGIWYMDAIDHYKNYDHKKVRFRALVYNPDKFKKGFFVPGRFAMTCCVEDITFIGFLCKYDRETELAHRSWIDITAEIHIEFLKEYKGKGPVLYPISITPAEKPKDEIVYFT